MNLTGFVADLSLRMDSDGCEVLSVVVKGTFRFTTAAQLILAEEQAPLRVADVYRGDPATASLAGASDMVLFKPATDILVSGCYYPNRRDPNWNFAGFRFGPQKMRKLVQVFGDRRWEKRLVGMGVSKPVRFEKIPMVYERAFGGADDAVPGIVDICPENPVGVGFRGKRSRKEIAGQPRRRLRYHRRRHGMVGVLQNQEEMQAAAEAKPMDAIVDGERIVMTGKKEVILRCGKASIALTADGKVVVRGAKIISAAEGLHRIRGATVEMN